MPAAAGEDWFQTNYCATYDVLPARSQGGGAVDAGSAVGIRVCDFCLSARRSAGPNHWPDSGRAGLRMPPGKRLRHLKRLLPSRAAQFAVVPRKAIAHCRQVGNVGPGSCDRDDRTHSRTPCNHSSRSGAASRKPVAHRLARWSRPPALAAKQQSRRSSKRGEKRGFVPALQHWQVAGRLAPSATRPASLWPRAAPR